MEKIEWFKKYSGCLKVSKIEREISCPRGTLDKWLSGERELSNKWEEELEKFLDSMFGGVGPLEIEREGKIVIGEKKLKSKLKESPGMISGVSDIPDVIKNVVVDKVISKVDVTSGEIKENKNIVWGFNGLDKMDKVEPYIFTDGNRFAVMKYFGNVKKYTIVDSLNEAQEIIRTIK